MMSIHRASTVAVCLALLVSITSAATVPRKSPEFAINMNTGSQVLLSQHRGKVVVLAFVLTYCSHCQFTTSILARLQREYGPRGLQVLASAIEPDAAVKVPGFIIQFRPGFPVGYNERNTVMEYLQHPVMLQLFMPQLVFIDRQGTIRSQYSGDNAFFGNDIQEKNIREQIELLLKENTAAQKKNGTAKARKKG